MAKQKCKPPGVDVVVPGDDGMQTAQCCEGGNLCVALTMMANEGAAASGRRVAAADQLSADSQRMWTIAMTTPTNMAAHGMRIASESGSGRTRAETNAPAGTAALPT